MCTHESIITQETGTFHSELGTSKVVSPIIAKGETHVRGFSSWTNVGRNQHNFPVSMAGNP